MSAWVREMLGRSWFTLLSHQSALSTCYFVLGCLCNLGRPRGLMFPTQGTEPRRPGWKPGILTSSFTYDRIALVMQLRSPYVSSGFRDGWIWGVQVMLSCFLCFASTLSLSHFALQSTSLFWLLESGFIFRYVLVRSSAPSIVHWVCTKFPSPPRNFLVGALMCLSRSCDWAFAYALTQLQITCLWKWGTISA